MEKRQEKLSHPFPPKVKKEGTKLYGLTAVTLGQILKGRLDEVASANGNRSEIIRDALESYFRQLPKLREEEKRRQNELRARALAIVLFRVLKLFEEVFTHTLDFDDAFPEDLIRNFQTSIFGFEKWLEERIPSPDDDGNLTVPFPKIERAVRALEHAGYLLWQADTDDDKWRRSAEQWSRSEKVPIKETQSKE